MNLVELKRIIQKFKEEELFKIAESKGHSWFSKFPNGCCGDSCRIMLKNIPILEEEKFDKCLRNRLKTKYLKQDEDFQSHAWLENDKS